MLKEFKDFAVKGNVLDLATAVIIGGAFGKIVTSLVNDIITPPIGLALGGVNFNELAMTLKAADGDISAVEMKYGSFMQTVIDFAIIALVIFLVVRVFNSLKKKEEAALAPPAEPTKEETLLTEIRDALRAQDRS